MTRPGSLKNYFLQFFACIIFSFSCFFFSFFSYSTLSYRTSLSRPFCLLRFLYTLNNQTNKLSYLSVASVLMVNGTWDRGQQGEGGGGETKNSLLHKPWTIMYYSLAHWYGASVHYVILSKTRWKPFWLAAQLYPQNGWLGGNGVYSSLFRAPASGGRSKSAENPRCAVMQKFTRFALISLGPAQPQMCECPHLRYLSVSRHFNE